MSTPNFEQLFDLTQGAIIGIASRLLPLPAATRGVPPGKSRSPATSSFYRESSLRRRTNKGCRDETLTQWMKAAELELTAFLRATSQVVAGLPPEKASDLWIRVLNMTEWNGDEPEQFFRLISILAAAEVSRVMPGVPSRSVDSLGRVGAAANPKSGQRRAVIVGVKDRTSRAPNDGEKKHPC